MYESFGVAVDGQTVTFSLFIPDATKDPEQYERGGSAHIAKIRVPGTFQSTQGGKDWDESGAPELVRADHPSGDLWSLVLHDVPDGWYLYKYLVTFEGGEERWVGDPCARYLIGDDENAGFVVGGTPVQVKPLANPRPLEEHVIYQILMLDFTAGYRGTRTPADAVVDRLDHLVGLGVTAIQFLPWLAWPDEKYNWGYLGDAFFAPENQLIEDPAAPLDRLSRLAGLVNACHERGLAVFIDGVYNQVNIGTYPGRGFPYYHLYRDRDDSPYVGAYEGTGFPTDLDYANGCTEQFIKDSCLYWVNRYQLDGIRFDYSLGYYRPGDLTTGLGRLIGDLRTELDAAGRGHVVTILEHMSDDRFAAIDVVNEVGASSCWFDPAHWELGDAARDNWPRPSLLRALDTRRGFAAGHEPTVYLSNHDHSSLITRVGGRQRWWAAQPAIIALYTVGGAVQLYNGQEFGQEAYLTEDGSDPGRVVPRPLDWELADDDIGCALSDLHRRLAAIRAAHPVLRTGAFRPRPEEHSPGTLDAAGHGLDSARGLVIYLRSDPATGGHALVVLNFSTQHQTQAVTFPHDGLWKELLADADAQVTGHVGTVAVQPNWGRIYVNEGNV